MEALLSLESVNQPSVVPASQVLTAAASADR
jgi:hypothetical protein